MRKAVRNIQGEDGATIPIGFRNYAQQPAEMRPEDDEGNSDRANATAAVGADFIRAM